MTREEQIDWLCRLRADLNNGIVHTPWNEEFTEALTDVLEHDTLLSENKGEWIYDKAIENWRCSKCNETPKTLGYVGTDDFMREHFKFCNHCGADMRGDT